MPPLDEVSVSIGRLESGQEQMDRRLTMLESKCTKIGEKIDRLDEKIDKLMAHSNGMRLTMRHWAMILASSGATGGAIAHALRKILP